MIEIRIYIAGPITGTNDYKERFAIAEYALRIRGWNVINPAKISTICPDDFEWSGYMDVGLAFLRHCDAIYMLDGWNKSEGAKVEFSMAKNSGKRIYFENSFCGECYENFGKNVDCEGCDTSC